jgi:hypothetical protein
MLGRLNNMARDWQLQRRIALSRREYEFFQKKADEHAMPLNTFLKFVLIQSLYKKSIAEQCEEYGRIQADEKRTH